MSNLRRVRLVGMLVSLYVVGASAIVARQPLTYQERVGAQEAIERVYYTHRIWPKENPEPKPPFEKMVAKAEIEAKVTDYLKKSEALDRLWQKPIQPEQLQAEMDRMVKGTRDPAMLKEIFVALNDDPALIAECLVRPLLADRLIHNRYFSDTRFHSNTREQAERALEEADPENLESWPQGEFRKVVYKLQDENLRDREWGTTERIVIQLDADAFAKMSADYPELSKLRFSEEREGFLIAHVVSKSEKELVMEGLWLPKRPFDSWWSDTSPAIAAAETPGGSDNIRYPGLGADMPEAVHAAAWAENALVWPGVPDPRSGHTAVWTGSEMLVWGGFWQSYLNTGGRYNPATDTWVATSTGANCPSARKNSTAVWTGSEMIVWGGVWSDTDASHYENTGGRYNPSSDTWMPMSTSANCPSARANYTVIWTGAEMIVWGGYDNSSAQNLNSGGRYAPSSDSWKATSTGPNCPLPRQSHTSVWTGSEMIVWGGAAADYPYTTNTGARYNPGSDTWAAISTGTNCPAARGGHTAVWTGKEMIVWGGSVWDYPFAISTGARYNPMTDSWAATSTGANCPSARYGHSAVWAGTEMVIWGGNSGATNNALNTGGRYKPSTDNWTATSTGTNCPSARYDHTAVWTGSEMIVWGGGDKNNTGGRYQPSSDTWTATSLGSNCPSAREHHTAIWTGAEMIVWGGDSNDINLSLNTGARYAPATDSWTSTSTGNNCPCARYAHSAVWTGSDMIVWGGVGKDYLITGGRYNPSSDTWMPTSTGAGCPTGRMNDTAVWTGTEMIIWGGVWYDIARGTVYESTGGRYNPSSDLWIPTSKAGPQARASHTAVWTGTEMIVWGGFTDNMDYNSGGRYSPASDTWTSTSTGTNCPSARYQHTAVWTGTEMILWGGHFYDGSHHYYYDGGRYNPSSDTWRATSVASDCPSARYQHTAVWTGAEMLVWGGGTYSNGSSEYFNTGGRYDPSLDAWTAIPSGTNCPSGRMFHTAIWTGTAMAVWGGITGAGVTQTGGSFVLNPIAPPVPAQIKKAAAPTPFTLIVTGTNLQNGISVRINGTPWTGVTWVSTSKIKIRQGKTLKALVPKGQTTQLLFVNPDGGQAIYNWSW